MNTREEIAATIEAISKGLKDGTLEDVTPKRSENSFADIGIQQYVKSLGPITKASILGDPVVIPKLKKDAKE